MPETLGQRLKHIRGTQSQQAFARRLGIGIRALQHYEYDERKPTADVLHAIAGFGWNPLWLLTGAGDDRLGPGEDPAHQVAEALATILKDPSVERTWQLVKRANQRMAGQKRDAGDTGTFVVLDRIETQPYVDWLAFELLGVPARAARLVAVRGSQLESNLREGDLALIDTGDTVVVAEPRIFAVHLGDSQELHFRMIRLTSDGGWQITGGQGCKVLDIQAGTEAPVILGRVRGSWRPWP